MFSDAAYVKQVRVLGIEGTQVFVDIPSWLSMVEPSVHASLVAIRLHCQILLLISRFILLPNHPSQTGPQTLPRTAPQKS